MIKIVLNDETCKVFDDKYYETKISDYGNPVFTIVDKKNSRDTVFLVPASSVKYISFD